MNELNIHTRLREARKYLELNQLEIANELNIKQKTVSEIENGKIMNIPNKYIYFFYKKGISLEWIYSGAGRMTQNDNTNKVIGEKLIFTEQESNTDENILSMELTHENKVPDKDYFKLLLHSKDENIQNLFNYIRSQEKMIAFLQEIIRKELKL